LFIKVADDMEFDREFITGTVTVLILSLLTEREMYGYELLQEAERRSARELQLKEGTLYPALHHMEQCGLLKSVWRSGDAGPRRKYYSLTPKGRRQAQSKRRQWETLAGLMRTILGGANG
jgi:PadR family transcriptional regulator, regulatory protein PadR